MKIAIGADHAGFELKEEIRKYIEGSGHEVADYGAYELDKDDDYPDFVLPVAWAISDGTAERGIIFGSSGEGEAMATNRVTEVRAMVYYGPAEPLQSNNKKGELRGLIHEGREDNDSNILSIGASFVSFDNAKKVIDEWLSTSFTGQERHKRRIAKLDSLGL